jgi:hypothetical protein
VLFLMLSAALPHSGARIGANHRLAQRLMSGLAAERPGDD